MAATAGEAVGAHHVAEGQGVYLEAQGQRSARMWPPTPWDFLSRPRSLSWGSLDWTTTGQGQLQARHSLARARRSEGAAREAGLGLSQQCSALARLRGLTPHSRTHSIRRSLPRKPHRLLSL